MTNELRGAYCKACRRGLVDAARVFWNTVNDMVQGNWKNGSRNQSWSNQLSPIEEACLHG